MKNKNESLRSKKRIKLVVISAILVSASVFAAYLYYDHRKEQQELKQNLVQAGEQLDVFADDLSSVGFENVERIERCYRAARKFESEPIYCEQRLRIRMVERTDLMLIKQASSFEESLLDQNQFTSVVRDEEEIAFTKGTISRSYDFITSEVGVSCWVHLSALDNSQERRKEARGKLEIDVACTEGKFDSFIYPEVNLRQ